MAPKKLTNEERARRQQAAEQRRQDEEAREKLVAELRARLAHLHSQSARTRQLSSVLTGVYDEMDKLSKKAPADQITELALKRLNDVITKCKELMQGDEFIDSIDLFVAAGERPEHRDAVLVLRELRDGIKRLEHERESLSQRALQEKWSVEGDEDDEADF